MRRPGTHLPAVLVSARLVTRELMARFAACGATLAPERYAAAFALVPSCRRCQRIARRFERKP